MGRFAAFDDPCAEREIEAHLGHIVAAIRSRMEPKAIILRGSFGRGEGSVCWENGRLRFLSDYEIDVATFSPLYRSCFRALSRQLTAETGVSTTLRWVRPDFLRTNRIGPIPWGPTPVTISLYESRYGSRILYGEDLIRPSPDVDPTQILPESGLELMLNRMAESLSYMVSSDPPEADDLMTYHWINKTILACAESLLVLWRSYHYSYRERGLRFCTMAGERLDLQGGAQDHLAQLVARATEFKLCPRKAMYPDSPRDAWLSVTAVVDPVFRLLVGQILGIQLQGYEQFPERYLCHMSDRGRSQTRSGVWLSKLVEVHRSVRAGRFPKGLLRTLNASHVVYGAVPPVFLAYGTQPKVPLLDAARQQLGLLEDLDSPERDFEAEWNYLRQRTAWSWRVYCY